MESHGNVPAHSTAVTPPLSLFQVGAMNKPQSKESLKDKVKGILGLGGPRPPSKQSDFKPSEFIITTDIIRVRRVL